MCFAARAACPEPTGLSLSSTRAAHTLSGTCWNCTTTPGAGTDGFITFPNVSSSSDPEKNPVLSLNHTSWRRVIFSINSSSSLPISCNQTGSLSLKIHQASRRSDCRMFSELDVLTRRLKRWVRTNVCVKTWCTVERERLILYLPRQTLYLPQHIKEREKTKQPDCSPRKILNINLSIP